MAQGFSELELVPSSKQEAGQALPAEAQSQRANRAPGPLVHLSPRDRPRALNIPTRNTQSGIVASSQEEPVLGAPSLTEEAEAGVH